MPDSITAKTGNAKVMKQGHQRGTQFGSDNTQKPVGRGSVTEERAGK